MSCPVYDLFGICCTLFHFSLFCVYLSRVSYFVVTTKESAPPPIFYKDYQLVKTTTNVQDVNFQNKTKRKDMK